MCASLTRAGGVPLVSTKAEDVISAPAVVVPGVGTFGATMEALHSSPGLVDAIKTRVAANKPTLFVCVGLQILGSGSEESPDSLYPGLGLLPGVVATRFPSQSPDGDSRPVPQQGWAKVTPLSVGATALSSSGYAFFSNSYCIRSAPLGWSVATADYGIPYVAGIERGNILALQFHPELSGAYGLAILEAFLGMASSPADLPEDSASNPSPCSPHSRRIIPCLDCKDGRVVKGVQFEGLRDAGDPIQLATAYEEQGADEIVILDISATPEARATSIQMIRDLRNAVLMPMTVGGGVRSVESAGALLEAGADKVAVNTAAVRDPQLLSRLSSAFGSQCIVVAVDARSKESGDGWEVVVKSGAERTGKDAIAWAVEATALGAGEVLLTSFDRDGTRAGYDLDLLRAVSDAVSVPVVASGGADSPQHMVDAIVAGADAVLAASIFHYQEHTVGTVKAAIEHIDPSIALRPVQLGVRATHAKNLPAPTQALVPSIDLMNGHAVQLVGGDPDALEIDAGDSLDAIASRFALAGEIAVIDLDAALSRGSNSDTIKTLCKKYPCRVGGGIRTVDAALDYLQAGARSVIIGTKASPEFLSQLPRERVLVALDAVHGEVVVDGWTTKTGESVADRIATLAPYCAGFLVTFVEREGRMVGIDRPAIADLVAAVIAGSPPDTPPCTLTIAGGIRSSSDLADLFAMGASGQVGMSLYSGELDLGDAIVAPLVSDRPDGLFPTVVVDTRGQVLGQAYSSAASIRVAVAEQAGVYWSRSRGLWRKGATSGAMQTLHSVSLDCDADALRFVVSQAGSGFCHDSTRRGCFASFSTPGGSLDALGDLFRTLTSRLENAPPGSYTKRLFDDPAMLSAKFLEEAGEFVEALSTSPRPRNEVIWEAADVLYFLSAGLVSAGVDLVEVEHHLASRSLHVKRRAGNVKPDATAAVVAQTKLSQSPLATHAVATDGAPTLRRVSAEEVLSGETSVYIDAVDPKALAVAQEIMNDLEARGEEALLETATRLGDLKETDSYWAEERKYTLGKEAFEAAFRSDALTDEQRKVLLRCAGRIETFAKAQKGSLHPLSMSVTGGEIGHTISPVDVAGCYAPGGRYPLPSTVLMTAITARVAGCGTVVVASPHPDPVILAACHVAKVDTLLTIGGAQAIGAMALGIGAVPRCDAIVGPGSRWVTAAKSLVAGKVAIDMLAGPSEVLVLADDSADPELVAADLLAQSEHDVAAVPILVATSEDFVAAVDAAAAAQLASSELATTAETASASYGSNGMAIVVSSIEEGVAVANVLAPEHLEVQIDETAHDLAAVADGLRHYGSLFLGPGAAEVLGDYSVGVNHTLPTGGTARAFGGLSVLTFLRVRTFIHMTNVAEARETISDAVVMAGMEGLKAHRESARRRLDMAAAVGGRTRRVSSAASPPVTSGPLSFTMPGMVTDPVIKFALPKGRMNENIISLLADAGVKIKIRSRSLRPKINLKGWDVKLLKPRDTVRLIRAGQRDVGFAGIDLIEELGAGDKVVPYFATGMDPVRVVAAAPDALLAANNGELPTDRQLVIATEYSTLTQKWIKDKGLNAVHLKTGGATEVFVPEDADILVDNTATGDTLRANHLSIFDVLMHSETYVIASKDALADPVRRAEIDRFVLLLKSALDGRDRVMIEFNVERDLLEDLIPSLPALKNPTVAELYGGTGFAVRTAVSARELTTLVPRLKSGGASDIVVMPIHQLIM